MRNDFKTGLQLGVLKPWDGRNYRTDVQDNPEYWNQPDVLMSEGMAMARLVDIHADPKYGWEGWSPLGMMDLIDAFIKKYKVPKGTAVLELGCGGGKQLYAWGRYNKDMRCKFALAGIDHSRGAVEAAHVRVPEAWVSCMPAIEIRHLRNLGNGFTKGFGVIYTHTMLQHNSHYKLKQIVPEVHTTLSDEGLFWLINELTIDSEDYVGIHHPEVKMSPWQADERGSHGTAAWWIGLICDQGFELLEYEKSSYVFRRI